MMSNHKSVKQPTGKQRMCQCTLRSLDHQGFVWNLQPPFRPMGHSCPNDSRGNLTTAIALMTMIASMTTMTTTAMTTMTTIMMTHLRTSMKVPLWRYVPTFLLYNLLTHRSGTLLTQAGGSWTLTWTQCTVFDMQVMRVSLYSPTSPVVAEYWLSAAHGSGSFTATSPLLLADCCLPATYSIMTEQPALMCHKSHSPLLLLHSIQLISWMLNDYHSPPATPSLLDSLWLNVLPFMSCALFSISLCFSHQARFSSFLGQLHVLYAVNRCLIYIFIITLQSVCHWKGVPNTIKATCWENG